MRIAFFSTKDYDKASFEAANARLPEGERCVRSIDVDEGEGFGRGA